MEASSDLASQRDVRLIRKKNTDLLVSFRFSFILQSPSPFPSPIFGLSHPNISTKDMLFPIMSCCLYFSFHFNINSPLPTPWRRPNQTWSSSVRQCKPALQLPRSVGKSHWNFLPLCSPLNGSPAAREKDLLPPPSLEHQNPPRARSKPPSGKTAPRKEPRSATNSNNSTVTPPAAQQQQTPVTVPAVTANQVCIRVCVCVREMHVSSNEVFDFFI